MKRCAKEIKAATKLFSTLNESVAKLRERLKVEEGEDFEKFEAQLKAALVKAQMKSDGIVWLKQMIIHYITNKIEAVATSRNLNSKNVPAEEIISKVACDH